MFGANSGIRQQQNMQQDEAPPIRNEKSQSEVELHDVQVEYEDEAEGGSPQQHISILTGGPISIHHSPAALREVNLMSKQKSTPPLSPELQVNSPNSGLRPNLQQEEFKTALKSSTD